MQIKILRINKVIEKTGLSKRTIYHWMSQGKFPEQIQYGNSRIVFWCEKTIDSWIANQMKIA